MSCVDDWDDHLRWLAPTDLNLDDMGITHLYCVTRVQEPMSRSTHMHYILECKDYILCPYLSIFRTPRVVRHCTHCLKWPWPIRIKSLSNEDKNNKNNVHKLCELM